MSPEVRGLGEHQPLQNVQGFPGFLFKGPRPIILLSCPEWGPRAIMLTDAGWSSKPGAAAWGPRRPDWVWVILRVSICKTGPRVAAASRGRCVGSAGGAVSGRPQDMHHRIEVLFLHPGFLQLASASSGPLAGPVGGAGCWLQAQPTGLPSRQPHRLRLWTRSLSCDMPSAPRTHSASVCPQPPLKAVASGNGR